MSYSEEIVKRIRAALKPWQQDIEEKRMFGGTCFLYKGKMCVGESKERLMVRVVSEKMNQALKPPEAKQMIHGGKLMKEFFFVSHIASQPEEALQYWIELGIEHAQLKSK